MTDIRGESTGSISVGAGPVIDDSNVGTGETGVEGKDADAVTDVYPDTKKKTRRDPVDAVGRQSRSRLRGARDHTTAGLFGETAGVGKRWFQVLLRAC